MLVGRDLVLAAGDVALAATLAGRGRLLLLAGEAGIGKTTVARAIAERSTAAGAVLRWGACWEGGALLPIAVWVDCLRRPGGDACAVAAERLAQGELDLGADAAAAERVRVRFFTDVIDALRTASADRPQVVVLEDVHWADHQSLQLLRAVAAHLPSMPVLVVATYRDDELAPGGPLAGIGGGAERLTLEGLGEDDVASLLTEVLDRRPSLDEARHLRRQTGGNPLFVTQLARLVAAGSAATLPSGVRDVLARRLARVSPVCDQVLGAAAVLGTEFDPAAVAAMVGETGLSVLDIVDEAVAARLVVAVEGRPDRWAFVHALVRTARYEALGTAERSDLHRRATEALEGRPSVPAGVIAHHAALARFAPDDPRPAALTAAAAREALARLAWDDASVLAQRALDLAPPGAAGDEVRAEGWLALGDARLRIGDDAGAGTAFAAAAGIAQASARPELLARAALGFGAGLGSFEVRLLDHRQLELLEQAATGLPAASPLRPLVLARLSVALSYVGSDERRLALADEAAALASDLGDGRALASALAARCDVVAGPDHVAERLGAATEIVALAQRVGDLGLELLGRRLRVVALLEMRDHIGFDSDVAAYARAADRLGDPLYSWYVPLWGAMKALADGRLDEALRLVEEARATGVSGGSANANMLTQVQVLFVMLDRREITAGEAVWAAMMVEYQQWASMVPTGLRSFIDALSGRADRARAELDRFGHQTLETLPCDQEWLAGVAQFVLGAAACGHEETLRRCYELLGPHAGVGVFEGVAAVDHGVVDRFLALAAGHLGETVATLGHVEAASERIAGSGRLVVAHTRADGARALFATRDEAVIPYARELARTAIGEYEALGLDALAAELSRLLAGAGNAAHALPPAAAAAPAAPAAPAATLVREGDTWAFTFGGATSRVRHAKGIADLAVLLARRDRDVHVRELEGVAGLPLPPPSSAQPTLDDTAVAQYRQRLRDLEDELDEADRHDDAGRAALLAVERDALVDELTRAFGLAGRSRGLGSDPDERLRKAVSARVKASIDRLAQLDPALGRHLHNSVRTGFWCSYRPEHTVAWEVVSTRPAPA